MGWNRTIRVSRGKRGLQTPRRGQAAAVDTVATRGWRRLSQWLPVGGSLHPAEAVAEQKADNLCVEGYGRGADPPT